MKSANFDALTGEVTYVDAPVNTLSLSEAQTQQITLITNDYRRATQTFQSSALGSVFTYLADDTSLGKFNAEYAYVNSTDYDGLPILWYTLEQGGVNHTKDQFCQVWKDGRLYLRDKFNKWDTLVKQIKSNTKESDVPTVMAITW
ncbi:hypothetical protein [Paenibacillus cremeus]|uniref:Uncharacterized protein n=1 Tax=Paenibacillus cremeus TaxID=2163881 RepID=A0A559KCW4_9BACL|nr:hypothetical protein [Paenibacillus cremeus]TVY09978.1 hypothetical protein FPZ49_11445 [Paenibacillus cremeus]